MTRAFQSCRSAIIGSTFVARRAGKYQASCPILIGKIDKTDEAIATDVRGFRS